MAIDNGWGKAHLNNDIGFGGGNPNNDINWGIIYKDSPSGETYLIGMSQQALDFRDRVETDSGVVEALSCVSNSII